MRIVSGRGGCKPGDLAEVGGKPGGLPEASMASSNILKESLERFGGKD